METLLFLSVGVLGGAVNAAAGGAKLFVFPMLVASGIPPISANATATVALWPAQLPAAWVYRTELKDGLSRLMLRLLPALLGGLLGALTLISSSEEAFLAVVPALLILAVTAIALGPRSADLLRKVFAGRGLSIITAILLFACGFYGGYFGAGLGFMLLAVLSVSDALTLSRVNGAKNVIAAAINTIAVIPLSVSGLVDWHAAGAVLLGGLMGGYVGATMTRRAPERPMRIAVSVLGLILAISFLV
ncbi:sulfite exporter TauE/SafE family protein [Roseivivax marinus]|uniref:sulfite exporter TauE/SafE family protein n=1 Tax=Roseivivax marinus TaxID=1379903 RepID=UPI001F0354D9|nr:sulfite exporter TauE/SafE family protein [Roseivivax marinus]UMA64397.1 sulfite exporter TauE/SafE family protein [Roseivivax marinus]